MSKAKPKKSDERKRKIGSRQEVIERVLTPAEMESAQDALLDLLARKDALEEEKKALAAEVTAKIKRASADIASTLGKLRTKRLREEISVEEWLTAGNEIVKINADTGEQLGARNARADELQEELPLPAPPPPTAPAPEVETEAEPEAETDDPPDNVVAGDFGRDE